MSTHVLILSGGNHGFAESATVIQGFLTQQPDLHVSVTQDKSVLDSPALNQTDVLVLGTGFTRAERQADGSLARLPDLTPAQENGIFDFVAGGKGLVGLHGTGWWIGGRAVTLIGGHANWHPPGLTFTVHLEDPTHPITQGLADFEVADEIYMSAYDPAIHILATAEWSDRAHPIAWTHTYGQGRVFYSALGHSADTYTRPMMQRLVTQGVRWAGGGK